MKNIILPLLYQVKGISLLRKVYNDKTENSQKGMYFNAVNKIFHIGIQPLYNFVKIKSVEKMIREK